MILQTLVHFAWREASKQNKENVRGRTLTVSFPAPYRWFSRWYGWSASSVRKAIRELKVQRYIQVTAEGPGKRTLYQLTPEFRYVVWNWKRARKPKEEKESEEDKDPSEEPMEMQKSEYKDQLKDPRWQKKRLQIFERDQWKCVECGNGDETLNVHHRKYRKGRRVWEYRDEDLVTLCMTCHRKHHPEKCDPVEKNVSYADLQHAVDGAIMHFLEVDGPMTWEDLLKRMADTVEGRCWAAERITDAFQRGLIVKDGNLLRVAKKEG